MSGKEKAENDNRDKVRSLLEKYASQLEDIELREIDPDNHEETTELFTDLHVQSLSEKTLFKKHIRSYPGI